MTKNPHSKTDLTENGMAEWGALPLLPLRCVLQHLCAADALAAMAVCRHWRSAVLLYEGHKERVKLEANQLDKCLFVTRMFRKYTNKLHIHLNCNEEELDKFMSYVLPQYFDSVQLHELIFIGPRYLQMNSKLPAVKLKRIITESLIHKHSHSLRKLALLGCQMGDNHDSDRYVHRNVELYSRGLSFPSMTASEDALLSRHNTALMLFSPLQHIIMDYEQVSTCVLETLLQLPMLSRLTINVSPPRGGASDGMFGGEGYKPVDWLLLAAIFPDGFEVAVNLIEVPGKQMRDVMQNVLREGMPLTSIKVIYCRTVCQPLIEHVVRLYKNSLKEVVWADCPRNASDPYARQVMPGQKEWLMDDDAELEPDPGFNVNPFVLLCWQCKYLRRLVIHGYWVWQYDLLGFARLRKSLCNLEVSCVHPKQDLFSASDAIVRALAGDAPQLVTEAFVKIYFQVDSGKRSYTHQGFFDREQKLIVYDDYQRDLLHRCVHNTISQFSNTCVHAKQDLFSASDSIVRALAGDAQQHVTEAFVKEMNEHTRFKWRPTTWSRLPPGLRIRPSATARSTYAIKEITAPHHTYT